MHVYTDHSLSRRKRVHEERNPEAARTIEGDVAKRQGRDVPMK